MGQRFVENSTLVCCALARVCTNPWACALCHQVSITLQGTVLKPRKGDAVLVWALTTDGQPELHSTYGFCPVTEGIGWVAVKR
jgi:hypothetical protein